MPRMLSEMRRCFEDIAAGSGSELGGLPDVESGGVLAEVSVAAAVRAGRARAGGRVGRIFGRCSASSGYRRTFGFGSAWTSCTRRSCAACTSVYSRCVKKRRDGGREYYHQPP